MYYAIISVFAHYVGPKFHAVQDDAFIKRLMTETPFINLVLSFYVPVMELKGAYGHHIEMMLSTSNDTVHQAFGHSLLATRALLDGDNGLGTTNIFTRFQTVIISPFLRDVSLYWTTS